MSFNILTYVYYQPFHNFDCNSTNYKKMGDFYLIIELIHGYLMVDVMLLPMVIILFKSDDDLIHGINKLDQINKLSCF